MNTLNFEEFEMDSNSMSKVKGGGDIVQTGGWLYESEDGSESGWCNSDLGSVKLQAYVLGWDCEAF